MRTKAIAISCVVLAVSLSVAPGSSATAESNGTPVDPPPSSALPGVDPSTALGPVTRHVLSDVTALSADDVWVVGSRSTGVYSDNTVARHWDGTEWTRIPSPSPSPDDGSDVLRSVAAVAPDDVWAVGVQRKFGYAQHGLIEHWDGDQWSVINFPDSGKDSSSLYSVTAVSSNDVWAVGVGWMTGSLVLHWNGARWSIAEAAIPQSDPGEGAVHEVTFNAVTGLSSSDVWAVGTYDEFDQNGEHDRRHPLIEHWDGRQWSVTPTDPEEDGTFSYLYGVDAVSATDAWAVGLVATHEKGEYPLLEHWDGTSWSRSSQTFGTGSAYGLSDVAAVAADDMWAVGYRSDDEGQPTQTLIEHWDGSSWAISKSANRTREVNILRGVTAVSSSNVWAVGYAQDKAKLRNLEEQWTGTVWRLRL